MKKYSDKTGEAFIKIIFNLPTVSEKTFMI
jgi:hypothetical protein